MKRLRILIAGAYPREGEICRGGVEAVTQSTARALAEPGDLDIHVATVNPGAKKDRSWKDGRVHVHVAKVPDWPASIRASWADPIAIARIVETLSPDLIHAHSQEGHALAAVRSGVPNVVSVHGLLQAQNQLLKGNIITRMIRSTLWAGVEQKVLADSSHTIVMSNHVAQAVQEESHARLHWVPNPIDTRFLSLEDRPEPGRILFVGLITPRKSLETLVEAARLAPDLRIRIAGATDDAGYEETLRNQARDLEDRVVFTGRLSEAELLEEYGKADVFALTSREDSAPVAISQALGAGTPVVASNVGGIPDMVSTQRNGLLVPPDDPAALASALCRIVEDRTLRSRMGFEARVCGMAHAPNRIAARLRKVYADILASTENPVQPAPDFVPVPVG